MSRIVPLLSKYVGKPQSLKICVHSGSFHLDDILACVLVNYLAKKMGVNLEIIRSRREEDWERCDLVLDVGGRNQGKWFDHHQSDFVLLHPGTTIKLATAGLVWDDLKDHILFYVMGKDSSNPIAKDILEQHILKKVIIPSDASDNGQGIRVGSMPLTLDEIVKSFNKPGPEQDDQFFKALGIVEQILENRLEYACEMSLEDERIYREIVTADPALKEAGILYLEAPGPWATTVRRHWDESRHLLVCVYPNPHESGVYTIQSLPADRYNRWDQRCSAPAHLKGYSEHSLQIPNTSGFPGLRFIHSNGFLGQIRGTLQEALAFAQYWINNSSTPPREIPTEAWYNHEGGGAEDIDE